MKKTVMASLAMIFFMSLFVNPVFAGSKQRYQWQGVAMGLGAAILGSAIINSCSAPEPVTVIRHEPYPCSYSPPRPRHDCCETRRIWVPPAYERVWNPAHYECGRWIPGQWIALEVRSGYWREERLWGCR
jgi:hypothetical protein